jgi:hypothetical protein
VYRPRGDDERTTLHWGQRKLLLSEIDLLTQVAVECPLFPLVIYAGAAPGHHVPFLAELFPTAHFVLVDPSQFGITPTERIQIRQEPFTDAIAIEFSGPVLRTDGSEHLQHHSPVYVGERTVFISDVRSADWKVMTHSDNEARIVQDQLDQVEHDAWAASSPHCDACDRPASRV